MREGWKALPLAKVCSLFTDGDWIETKDQSPEGVRLIQTGNVGLGEFKDRRRKARFVSEATFKRLNCQEVHEGDCLVSRLPDPVGRSCIVPASDDKMITAVDCTILRFQKEKLIPEFFNYYSQSAQYLNEVEAYCAGATRKRISRKNLGKVPILLPPLLEQERIVAILDEAFAGIATAVANTEKNLANARELFESYLNGVLVQQGDGWTQRTLVELCDIARGGSPRPIKAFLTNEPDGVNWIKISDATASSKFIYETKQKIRREGVRRSRMVHEGDLLLSNSMSFGRPYIMKTSGCIHDGWLVLSDKSGLYAQEYLYYFLGSSDAYRQFDSRASGSTVRNLNIDLVRTVRVPVPPLDKQHEIASNLEDLGAECNRLECLYHQKSDALAELKQSLLQKAFSGELTATPQDEIETALA